MYTYEIRSNYDVVIIKGIAMFDPMDIVVEKANEYIRGLGLTSEPRHCTIKVRLEKNHSFTEWTKTF